MTTTSRLKKKPAIASVEAIQTKEHGMQDLWKNSPELIKQFLEIGHDYEQLCAEIEYILRKRVSAHGIETASISSRAKTLNSFIEKLRRKQYAKPFEDVTDLAGARVVCLYQADTQKVSEIIRSEFSVVEELNKLDQLAVDQFGYGAQHFLVRLGKASSGARYDDLKQLVCEIQVRTVVQDAWSIIQHHMIYKRESQVPTQLQRKLNSLAGLFETVDDQFERIRDERDAYLSAVRGSTSSPSAFLDNELNFDSFKEYLNWAFPDRTKEKWDGQALMVLDALKNDGYKKLNDVHNIVKSTEAKRNLLIEEIGESPFKAEDGTLVSILEPALALALTSPQWNTLIPWGKHEKKIEMFRSRGNS